jgi:hypothetical protein
MKRSYLVYLLLSACFIASCAGDASETVSAENPLSTKDTLLPQVEKATTENWDEHYDTVPFRSVDQPLKGSADIVGFKFKGKPINHLLLFEFIGFAVSDRFSSIREVDLTVGNESNRFYMDFSKLAKEMRGPLTYSFYRFKNEYDEEISYGYSYFGKLKNGVHVLLFIEVNGDRAADLYLMGVRFHKEKLDYDEQPHVFMTCVKIEQIVQNSKYKIDAANNRLQVIPISNSPKADFDDLDLSPYWVQF